MRSGKICKLSNELKYGFVKVPKIGKVFISPVTIYEGCTFEQLELDGSVQITITDTSRGLFAKKLIRKD